MSTVTIQVDDELITRARELAAARGMSVPEMLERLLRVVTEASPENLPPLTRQSKGMLPPMSDEQVKQALDDHRTRKYGT